MPDDFSDFLKGKDTEPRNSSRKFPHRSRARGLKPILDDELAQLRFHRDRSGASTWKLLRGASDKPKGLNGAIIDTWLSGQTRSAIPEHIAYVLSRWAAMPDGARVALNDDMRTMLKSEFMRTGSGAYLLLKKATDAPAGLRARSESS